MKPKFYYPVKPHIVNQPWGRPDPLYGQFGFNLHNGVDHSLVTGQPVRSPFDMEGLVVRTGDQPKGGGIFLGLMSKEPYDFPDGRYRVLVDFLHCDRLLKKEGDTVSPGEIVALGDNTGLSTGPHCHTQWRRVSVWNGGVGEQLAWSNPDHNRANNSFDPEIYWAKEYAEDLEKVHRDAARVIPYAIRVIEAVKKFLTTKQK